MPDFPKLKTGAVIQYPAMRALRFRNQIVRFVDGTEQRYRDAAGPLHRWEIRLDQLDDGEIAAVEEFFRQMQGAFAAFAFTDPWDGQAYSNCSIEDDDLEMFTLGEMRSRTGLAVVENR